MPRQAEVNQPVSLRSAMAAWRRSSWPRSSAPLRRPGRPRVNSMQRSQALAEAVRLQLARRTAVEVEQVQDAVERALMAAGHFDTARAYIVYRERHARLRRDRKAVVDVAASMNEYLA